MSPRRHKVLSVSVKPADQQGWIVVIWFHGGTSETPPFTNHREALTYCEMLRNMLIG